MPSPGLSPTWHGVPREQIAWSPHILENVCIGCGTCVTGCSRLVFRFDFERRKPVVVEALNCRVGCTTCANTCPANAIAFPPLDSVLTPEGRAGPRDGADGGLPARRERPAARPEVPHPDRIVALRVAAIERPGRDLLLATLAPVNGGECFCEFTPGQYIELWQPGATHLSRAYAIANAPHGDGSITVKVRRVDGGLFAAWAFDGMKVGDGLQARGPLGSFTVRSRADTPLLFIAGDSGFAPVLALLEPLVRFNPRRDMELVWGMRRAADFYGLDTLRELVALAPGLRVRLVAEQADGAAPPSGDGLALETGTVREALLRHPARLAGRDLYIAGTPSLLRGLMPTLNAQGVDARRVYTDATGG